MHRAPFPYKVRIPLDLRAFTVACLSLLLACTHGREEDGPAPSPSVRTMVLKAENPAPLQLRGTIGADARLRLGFKLPGVISAVLVKEGDPVRKGQLLARLD